MDLSLWSAAGVLALPLLVAAIGAAARRLRPAEPRVLVQAIDSRWAPLALGVAGAAFLAWVWGSLAEPAFIHDEAAYLLQADIFAAGRLSAPPPPLPEFFEQYHVLVTPRLAPKYPPAHALMLVPGMWLGLPGLMPVALHGLAGAMLFALARRLANAWVAVLTWLVWLLAPLVNYWRCSYLSQSTSSAAFLLAAWLLLRWWQTGGTRRLVAIAVLVAGMAMTRPFTAVAIALPLGAVVVARCWRERALLPLLSATLAGVAVLGFLPLWSAASTGDWRTVPYAHYSRVYFPYEKPGFGLDPTPPLRELPPDMAVYDRDYRAVHLAHTKAALPRALGERVVASARELWGGSPWRPSLALFFALGLPVLGRYGWFAMAWVLSLFLAYLPYAHPPHWAVYYYEAHTVVAFATALGLWRALGWLAARSRPPTGDAARLAAVPAAVLGVLVLGAGLAEASLMRASVAQRTAYHKAFVQAIAAIDAPRAIVLVRYHPSHNPHRSLIENPRDHSRARIWVARDRGEDNRRLLEHAPDRVPYLFDEASFTLYRLAPISR